MANFTNFIFQDLKRDYPLIVGGEGCYIYDDKGRKIIDGAGGGVSCVGIGHGVKEVIKAMSDQANKLCFAHISQFATEPQLELATKLAKFAPADLDNVYFVSTGTEANELIIKMARTYHIMRGNNSKFRIISRWKGYHGSSITALSYSGRSGRRHKYHPYFFPVTHISPPYCYRCPWGKEYPGCDLPCAWELERVIRQEGPDNVSVFIAEPIINTAAAMAPPQEYFKIIRSVCDKYDVIFAVDEVITGFGRTGKNFGIEHWEVVPDMIACGKGMASGYSPLAGTIVHKKIYEVFKKDPETAIVGYTYGGNPLSCAVGLAVLEYIEKNKLVENASQLGEYFLNKLSRLRKLDIVGDIRGKGLMIGIEFVMDKTRKNPFPREKKVIEKIWQVAYDKGFTFCPLAGDADGILGDAASIGPALIISKPIVDKVVDILEDTIIEVQEWMGDRHR